MFFAPCANIIVAVPNIRAIKKDFFIGDIFWFFLYVPQKNSTIICAVRMRRNIDNGYTVE